VTLDEKARELDFQRGIAEAEARVRSLAHFEWGLFGCSIDRIVAVVRGETKCECGWPNTPPRLIDRKVCKKHGSMDYCSKRNPYIK
jgi:hypothetical protein